MEDYNFWADLLTTYRSNPDWLKFCWLFFPTALLVLGGHGFTRLLRARMGLAAGGGGDLTPHDTHTLLSSPPLSPLSPPRRRGSTFPLEERGRFDGDLLQAPDTPRLPWFRDVDPRLRGHDN